MINQRRKFIQQTGTAVAGTLLFSPVLQAKNMFYKPNEDIVFTLPALPYPTSALEPVIDQMTMEIHHGKHHMAYITNLNKAVSSSSSAKGKSIEELLQEVSKHGDAIRNNGGGHFNHSLFWQVMSPKGSEPSTALLTAINENFQSMENFKKEFSSQAMSRFGSGWVWLIVKDKQLIITTSPNQDNPLMDISPIKGTPILGLDVWEHAYYLQYQNKRADYVNAWWQLVHWKEVSRRFELALKG